MSTYRCRPVCAAEMQGPVPARYWSRSSERASSVEAAGVWKPSGATSVTLQPTIAGDTW